MEGRTKVTKDVLLEESRFILANVLAEGRYGRDSRYDDIRKVCEGNVSIPFAEYVTFLESAGYVRHDRSSATLLITEPGEKIVNGGSLTELTDRAVTHFKNLRRRQSGKALGVTSSGGRTSATVGGEISSGGASAPSRYDKLQPIGRGGLGTVYRARQGPLGREVALKELELGRLAGAGDRAEAAARFAEAVRAASVLSHPNIVPILDLETERAHPFVVSELAAGGSVRALVTGAESIPVDLAIDCLIQALHALRVAHQHGIVHRGLKPENLLFDAQGVLKVSDFGIARAVERGADQPQVYVGVGAVGYMAPELLSNPTEAGPQADLYALGIVFYELLARAIPGRRSPLPSQIHASIPAGLDDIFDRMTADPLGERYASADDVLADVAAIEGLDGAIDLRGRALLGRTPLAQVRFRRKDPPPVPHQGASGAGRATRAANRRR